MKVMFIIASVGKQEHDMYVSSWLMEPLAIAVLSALTPPKITRVFYDDRLEEIPFGEAVDLVAINMEAYTAARAYQIADEFRCRNVTVVLGGVHATLMPEEATNHADSVVIGEAEEVWGQLLNDFSSGRLQKFYKAEDCSTIRDIIPDRSIFQGKKYLPLVLVETARGCRFRCEFCSVAAYYKSQYKTRSIDIIVKEISEIKKKTIFFVDDNICLDRDRSKRLFQVLIPLKIKWVSQVSMHICKDYELLSLMKKSGCQGVLIGFESMNRNVLHNMKKDANQTNTDYGFVVSQFHRYGMAIYATFVMGYNDTVANFEEIYRFGIAKRILYVAFNHLVPFPGTPLYERLEREKRLKYEKWWLEPSYRFGDVVFNPTNLSAEELTDLCWKYRYKFYNLASSARRLAGRIYWLSFYRLLVYIMLNIRAKAEFTARRRLLIGGWDNRKFSRRSAKTFVINLAKKSDDLSLQKILYNNPMEGDIQIAFQRKPNYFDAIMTEGSFNQTIVARNTKKDEIAGMGSRSIKLGFVNGRIVPIGYLSSLRIRKEYRNSSILGRGYAYLKRLHQDKRARLYLTTIIHDNKKVRQLLTSKRANLPMYHDVGEYRTFAIQLSHKKKEITNGVMINRATKSDLDMIIDCLHRNGREKQFYPYYRKEDFTSDQRQMKDFRLEDFYVAKKQGRIVGMLGKWDQGRYKQTIISGYSKRMQLVRPVYNYLAKITKHPPLPKPETQLTFFYVSFIAIDGNDPSIFATLLRQLYNDSIGNGYSYMMVGLCEKDSLLEAIQDYVSIEYKSRVYVVCWDDGESVFRKLDARIPYLETATL